jgi:hypothetical protein
VLAPGFDKSLCASWFVLHSYLIMLSLSTVFFASLLSGIVHAQPSPKLQQRISAAIQAAKNSSNLDFTAFVNPFIGTGAYDLSPEPALL